MRKTLTILFIILSFTVLYSQEEDALYNFHFEEVSVKDVIQQIEKETNFTFFFVEEWIDGKTISLRISNQTIENILGLIFNNTPINYYITIDRKIILTQYNLIYDQLPNSFLNKKAIESEQNINEEPINIPVFINDVSVTQLKKVETVRIGKENKSNYQIAFNLRGTIINKINGAPISDIVLYVNDKKVGAVTNEKGEYILKLKRGVNIIETRSLAFEELQKRVIIYSDGFLNFSLNESYEGLDEVLIQANIDNNVKEVSIGKTAVNVEKSKNIPLVLGERDIFKVALTLPGITSAGEGAAGYNVRGGKTDQNLILLDKATLYNPSHFFGLFSAVNPFTTEDVTIYKGNIPAQFGGRLSSVFDITSKDANSKKLKGEVSIGPVTSNIALEIPIVKDTSALLIGGRSTYSNWILKKIDRKELKNSKASYYDAIAKYTHKLSENNELKVSGYYSRDAFSITSDSLYSYDNRLVSLQWNHIFNDNMNANAVITNSGYTFNIDYDGNTNNDFNLNYSINETHLKLKLNHKINNKHTLNYGLSTKYYNVSPGNFKPNGANSIINGFNTPTERALESALFVSDTYKLNNQLSFDIGLRYSIYSSLGKSTQRIYEDGLPKNETTLVEIKQFGNNEIIKTYSNPEIRLSARYSILSDFSVKASYNSSSQYIHSLSNNTTVSPIDTWKLSDLNIKPQQSKQYSLGFFKNLNDNLFELSLEGYYKQMDDVLDYKVGAQLLLNQSIESEVLQGKGKAYGIEVLVKKMKGKLNGWLGYTYARSFVKLAGDFPEEVVNNGTYFPSNYDKPHDFSMVANYKLTKRFSLSANFVYQTGRPVTVPVGNYIYNGSEYVIYSDRNKYRIPDYYRLDISFNVEGNHKIKKLAHSFWNISIYNVLGKNNPYSVFFVTEDGEVKAYQSSIFSIPIPTITYNFKF